MIKLTSKYILFAIIATTFNLLAQRVMDSIYNGPLSYILSLMVGTLVGLIIKYILDKKYIFYYIVNTKQEDMMKFVVYSVMGVATTAIFWGFQTAFHLLWQVDYAKYVGALIGLSIGYFVKYQLDKRFVFKVQTLQVAEDTKQ